MCDPNCTTFDPSACIYFNSTFKLSNDTKLKQPCGTLNSHTTNLYLNAKCSDQD